MAKPLAGSSLLFGALLLSASPVLADDFVFLKCKYAVDLVTINSTTSEIIEDRTMDDIALLKVDLKNKTIFDTRSSRPLDIAIQDGMITLVVQSEDEEMKIDDAAKIELRPPYSLKQRGTIVFKSKNRTNTHNAEGQCKEIEASVFKRALKESDLR